MSDHSGATDYLALAERLRGLKEIRQRVAEARYPEMPASWVVGDEEVRTLCDATSEAEDALREAHAEIERLRENDRRAADAVGDWRDFHQKWQVDFLRAQAAEKKLEAVREWAEEGCKCEDCSDYGNTVAAILDQQEDTR